MTIEEMRAKAAKIRGLIDRIDVHAANISVLEENAHICSEAGSSIGRALTHLERAIKEAEQEAHRLEYLAEDLEREMDLMEDYGWY